MKLILRNETRYDTRSLRKLFLAGIKRNGLKIPGFARYNEYVALVQYSARAGIVSGQATVGGPQHIGSWMLLRLPRNPSTASTRLISYVMDHEFGHNLGLRHRAMKRTWRDHEDWAAAYPLKFAPLKEKPHEDPKEKRRASIEKRLKSWATKLKRAQTAIKKLTAQQRRYDKITNAAVSASATVTVAESNVPKED